MIADLCIKHNVLCISDEVYEWLTYDTAKHVKICKTTHLYSLLENCIDDPILIMVLISLQLASLVCGKEPSPLAAVGRPSVQQGGR